MRFSRPARAFLTALFLAAVSCVAIAATFTVTNTNDAGAGSLRQAILDANAAAGRRHDRLQHPRRRRAHHPPRVGPADHHRPGHDRRLHAARRQPEHRPAGDNAVLRIELDGTNSGNDQEAAVLFFGPAADGSVVRGLVINPASTPASACSGTATTVDRRQLHRHRSRRHRGVRKQVRRHPPQHGPANVTIGGTTPAAQEPDLGQHFPAASTRRQRRPGRHGSRGPGNLIGTDASGGNAVPNTRPGSTSRATRPVSPSEEPLRRAGTSSPETLATGSGSGLRPVSATPPSGNFVGTDAAGAAPWATVRTRSPWNRRAP